MNSLKQTHQAGIRGILFINGYGRMKKKPPLRCAFVVTAIVFFLFFFTSRNSYSILQSYIEIGISLLPNLLGFSLGGYALIVGFGNIALIKSMTDKLTGENGSLFQTVSAIFAFAILLQAASLIITYIIKIFCQFEISLLPADFEYTKVVYKVLNFTIVFILTFLYCWTMFIIPYIVTNIFTFGQTHHLYLTVEKLKEDQQKQVATTRGQPSEVVGDPKRSL